jgi:NADH-quinone oxidoreductase subunit J
MTDPFVSAMVFYALTALTLGGAAVVALSGNIVHSAFALFAALFGMAGLYAYLSADLVAVIQLLVYVGGISVLILFAVMLTSGFSGVGETNPSSRLFGGIAVAGALLAGIVVFALGFPTGTESAAEPTAAAIGDALLGKWVLPFEVASLVLVAALIGAVSLARGWRRKADIERAQAADRNQEVPQ